MSRKKEIKSLQEWSPSVGSNRNRQESFLRQHCHRARISWPRTVERQAGHLRLVLRGSNRDLWGEKTTTVFSEKLHFSAKVSRNTLHVVFLCSSFSSPALCYVPFLLKAPYEWQQEILGHRNSFGQKIQILHWKSPAKANDVMLSGSIRAPWGPSGKLLGLTLSHLTLLSGKFCWPLLPPPVLPQGWEYGGRSSARSFPDPKERHSTKLWN